MVANEAAVEVPKTEPRFKFWQRRRQWVQRGPSFRNKNDPQFNEPPLELPHFVFAGRTNVGKSALISSLFHRTNFASTSSVPGKTESVNTYIVNGKFAVADFPGHGLFDPGKSALLNIDINWRRVWEPLVFRFIRYCGLADYSGKVTPEGEKQKRNSVRLTPYGLHALFYLCDIRGQTTEKDKEFLHKFRQIAPETPVVLILTKDDQVGEHWRRLVLCFDPLCTWTYLDGK